jgi:hypothetical protein
MLPPEAAVERFYRVRLKGTAFGLRAPEEALQYVIPAKAGIYRSEEVEART